MEGALAWELAVALIVALLLYDFFFHVRKAHVPSLAEAARWSAAYIGIALAFGVAVLVLGGVEKGMEYFAGYVTEKALSADNVFVFLVVMSSFKVPRQAQQKVLLIGIVFALVARTGFIFLGAALLERFVWVFYVFGLVLLVTAGHLLRPEDQRHGIEEGLVIRLVRAVIPTTRRYDGDRIFTRQAGRLRMTPMALVVAAIAASDILFALDSIPAIFGLTQDVFIVFTATVFSLLGLRQLYFLIDGLLERLLYLSFGLAAILGFIGVKLVLHALHENNVPFINDGQPVNVIEIGTLQSLVVIVGILLVTVVVSLRSPVGRVKNTVGALRRHVADYLDPDGPTDAREREALFQRVLEAEARVRALPPELKKLIREPVDLRAKVARARALHSAGGSN